MTEKRNNLFDLLRVLFTISVVITHASNLIYHGEIVSANVAVDGFFMLSGFFMARHLKNRRGTLSRERLFFNYQISRIRRLLPMCLIVASLVGLKEIIVNHALGIEKWEVLYFLGDINGIHGFSVMWYVSALFWGGFLVSALLIWARKISVLVLFPLIFFVLFSFMYKYHNLWLFSVPLVKGFLSAGLFKSVCALCVGVEVFYISVWLKNQISKMRLFAVKLIAIFCEILFIYGFASSFWIWFSPKNFFVYFYVPLILLVFALDAQVIFSVFDRPILARLGKMTYAVYLTHLYIIKFLAKTGFCEKIPPIATYLALIPLTFFIGWIFSGIEKIVINFLMLVLFIQNPARNSDSDSA